MGMLNHKNKEQKNPLENDVQIKVEEQQNRDSILKDKEKKQQDEDTTPKVPRVTIPRNLRADNHIANKVQALINFGFADDAKGVLTALVTDKINSLPTADQERIENMANMLEIKDYYSQQSKDL